MNSQPLISIIIPIYNVERDLIKCLNSVLSQTYQNLEIILIDDGSPDNCGEICDSYAKLDSRVIVIHQENKGVSEARNAGISIAKGVYIGFIDSDDWIEPQMYELLLREAQNHNADITICGHYIHHNSDWVEIRQSIDIYGKIPQYKALEYLLASNMFEGYLWNKLFSHQLISKSNFGNILFFDSSIHIAEDLLFVCQCMLQCDKVSYISKPLYHYIIREGSALRSYSEKRESELIVRKKIITLLAEDYPELSEFAKDTYLEATINLVRYAARNGEKNKIQELRQEAKKHLRPYLQKPSVTRKSKFRVLVVLYFPILSDKIWSFLKNKYRLSWHNINKK